MKNVFENGRKRRACAHSLNDYKLESLIQENFSLRCKIYILVVIVVVLTFLTGEMRSFCDYQSSLFECCKCFSLFYCSLPIVSYSMSSVLQYSQNEARNGGTACNKTIKHFMPHMGETTEMQMHDHQCVYSTLYYYVAIRIPITTNHQPVLQASNTMTHWWQLLCKVPTRWYNQVRL